MLANKTCVVLGVANKYSIAWSVAKKLREHGAQVTVVYQNNRFEKTIQTLVKKEHNQSSLTPFNLFQCDVTSESQLLSLQEYLQSKYNSLDFLFHSIAHAPSSCLKKSLSEITQDEYLTTQNISSYSLISLVRTCRPLLTQSPSASVCCMTFRGSQTVFPGYASMGYAKASLESNIKYLAYELGKDHIRCNSISSGPLNTLAARGLKDFSSMKENIQSKQPLDYTLSTEDIANTALFLASDLSKAITGHVLYVDCGQHIMG